MTAPTYGASYGEGLVQGVVKATQTGILWSQVQVLVGPPLVRKATDFLVSGFFHQAIKNLGSVSDIVDFEVLKTIEWIV